MPDDTESYFVSLAVQRGVATREAAQQCLELARTPQAGGRSVMHILVERARIPSEVARGLHQEALAMATQARSRGSDLRGYVSSSSGSSSSSHGPSSGYTPTGTPAYAQATPPPMYAQPGLRPGPASGPGATVAAPPWPLPGAPQPHDTAAGSQHGTQGSYSLRARTFNPGESFARYRLESELGRGGMGVVWRARHLDLDRPVAIKMLLTGTSADDRRRARFTAEARAVAKLMHPNIVAVHDVGEFEGVLYFTMDLVDGPSLSEALKQAPFDLRKAVQVAKGIAEGLACAHAQQLVHRDLKPANIILDPRGNPKITDFGIAKDLAANDGHTQAGEVLGTPAYMPPEQAEGRTHLVDGRADVYALGAILYRMVAGRPPFEGATPYDVITKVLTVEPTPLRKLDRSVPEAVDRIALRCLQKDREKRYPTADAVAQELAEVLEDLGGASPRPRSKALPAHAGGGGGLSGGLLAVAVGAIVLAAGGTGVGVYFWAQARNKDRALAEQRRREEEERKADEERRRLREAAEKRSKAEELAKQALLRQQDSPQEALALARQAVELAPDAPDAQVVLGRLLLAIGGDPARAVEALDAALRAAPDHLAARVVRGRAWLKLGKAPAEVEAEAAHLDRLGQPGRAAAAELRAEVALSRNELAVAVVHLDEAVHLDEKDVALRLRLAELLLQARRFSAADEEASAALRLERGAPALVVRATARKELGRVADALADVEEALRLAKDDARAKALLAELRPRQTPGGHTPERPDQDGHEPVHAALRALKEALARKDPREAQRQLNLAMEMRDVPCPAALTERAAVLMDLERFQEAAADLDRLARLQGETASVWLLRAQLFVRTKRLDDAERAFARAVEVDPKDYHPHEALARYHEDQGRHEQVLPEYERAIAKAPPEKKGWLHHERAHYLHRLGKQDEALADMNIALDLDRSSAHMWFVRAELLLEMGKKTEAAADYHAALKAGARGGEEQRSRQRLQELGQ